MGHFYGNSTGIACGRRFRVRQPQSLGLCSNQPYGRQLVVSRYDSVVFYSRSIVSIAQGHGRKVQTHRGWSPSARGCQFTLAALGREESSKEPSSSDKSEDEEWVGENEVAMRELQSPPSSEDKGKRPGLFHRLASAIASILSVSAPSRMLMYLGKALTSRVIKLGLFFLIGVSVSYVGHMGARRSSAASRHPQEVVYSDFLNLVNSGNVDCVRFEEGTGRVLFDVRPQSSETFRVKKSSNAASDEGLVVKKSLRRVPRQFYTRHLPDPQLISMLRDASVEFGTVKASVLSGVSKIIATALALWIPLVPMFVIMRRFIDGRNGTTKSKKKKKGLTSPRVTFNDVAGVNTAKQELEEVVACLRDSTKFSRLGARVPSGVLLCGPPGTGKTLLAKAVAGEANVPFLSVSASEFVELFVGRGAARIRELFAEARKRSPCVIFIDELDAVGGKRGAGLNEERDQTLNQLLTELDGFEGRPGVVLLAATNRADVLDPALLRPGRLSRKVNVPLPDLQGRFEIMLVHLRNTPVEGGEEGKVKAAGIVARLGSGFSGAELANVVNEAAFLAAREDSKAVTIDNLSEAVLRTRFGVNGSQSNLPEWSKTLQQWLVKTLNNQDKPVRSQPLGS